MVTNGSAARHRIPVCSDAGRGLMIIIKALGALYIHSSSTRSWGARRLEYNTPTPPPPPGGADFLFSTYLLFLLPFVWQY